jgi:hypothetical protein
VFAGGPVALEEGQGLALAFVAVSLAVGAPVEGGGKVSAVYGSVELDRNFARDPGPRPVRTVGLAQMNLEITL